MWTHPAGVGGVVITSRASAAVTPGSTIWSGGISRNAFSTRSGSTPTGFSRSERSVKDASDRENASSLSEGEGAIDGVLQVDVAGVDGELVLGRHRPQQQPVAKR